MEKLRSWLDREFSKIQEELFAFLRFKTISTDPAYLEEHLKCCQWLSGIFQEMQFKTEIIETPGLPLFYAENLSAGEKRPTVLVYGHYDVQPVDPLELWKSDPFEPVENQGNVYARGALDDKGQIFFAAVAARALLAVNGSLPVNLKFCIEGEEESGSVGLAKSLSAIKKKISADYLLVVDCGLPDAETPAINLGGRGIATMELLLKGSFEDLHSGLYGGIAYNPNRALAELLAECWDENGLVRVPHFYDDVVDGNRQLFSEASMSEKDFKQVGIEAFAAPKGSSLLEANWFMPTLEINGIAGGYAGAGFKTVIPAEAHAKISCRLVPDQDPEKIGKLVADFFKKKVKKGIQIQVNIHPGGKPYCGSPDSPLAKAVAMAYVEIFNKPCLNTLSGGSIPIVSDLVHATGAEVVGMGYGLASDNMHAPNEHFGLDRFKKGILTVSRAMHHLGEACRQ